MQSVCYDFTISSLRRKMRDPAVLARLAELDALDPHWALAGNAGGLPNGDTAIRISDPYGEDSTRGSLPAR